VIVVDDDIDMQQLLRVYLAKRFDVVTCSSGEQVLTVLDSIKPDLILLDVDMPGINGYETCKLIRQKGVTIPIIFVTSYQNIEVHLTAYEAGGDDLITKPVESEILLHKATLAIRTKSEKDRLAQEAHTLHEMAMNFLSTAGENGVLLNFVRNGATAKSYEELAQHLVDSVSQFAVECTVVLRHPEGVTARASHGEPNHLEMAIMENMSTMGRLVEFKRQYIVNYAQVSVMIRNMASDSAEKLGRIRDNVAILTETAEALCENVFMRIQSMALAERMQVAIMTAASSVEKVRYNHHHLMLDTRILLQELVDSVESTYSWLSTSRSQEEAISGRMNESVQKILLLLSTENKFDDEIANVQSALNVENSENNVVLF
jgi:DNA-binding response OmpR family regulator